jgi:hypothetical protein
MAPLARRCQGTSASHEAEVLQERVSQESGQQDRTQRAQAQLERSAFETYCTYQSARIAAPAQDEHAGPTDEKNADQSAHDSDGVEKDLLELAGDAVHEMDAKAALRDSQGDQEQRREHQSTPEYRELHPLTGSVGCAHFVDPPRRFLLLALRA